MIYLRDRMPDQFVWVRLFSRDEGPLRWRRARRIGTRRPPTNTRNETKHASLSVTYARRAWHRPGGSMSRSAANPNRRRSLPPGTEQNRRSTTRTLPTERKRHGLRPRIAQRHDETPFRTQRSRTQFVCGAVLYAGRVIRSVGERLWAIPIDALWGGSATYKRTDVSPQDRRASTVTTASRSTHADKHADKQAARRRPKTHR